MRGWAAAGGTHQWAFESLLLLLLRICSARSSHALWEPLWLRRRTFPLCIYFCMC